MGHLDVALASGPIAPRTVTMDAGDTLAFTLHAEGRARGAITLIEKDGRERRLPYGPGESQLFYTAEQQGPVSFRLSVEGGKVATVLMTCTPRTAETRDGSGGASTMALDGLHVDMSVPAASGAGAASSAGAAKNQRVASPAPAPSAPDLKWIGGQQQAGAETPGGTYGVNLNLKPAIMVGMLAQFDQSADDPLLGPAALSDRAWMLGPVTNVQLGAGLSLDARAAWGPAANGPGAVGHLADRQTLEARLVSKQAAGAWRFSPSIGLGHVQERVGTAAGEPAADVAARQTIESGRVDVKPEMAYRIDMGHAAFIEPRIMVGTFWTLGDAGSSGTAGAQHGARHVAETGVTVGAPDGTKLQLNGGVEEGAPGSDNVWRGRLQLNIPLK